MVGRGGARGGALGGAVTGGCARRGVFVAGARGYAKAPPTEVGGA